MTLAKLYEASLTAMGLQPVQVYIIVTTAFFAVYWLIGYIDDIYGIWKAETSYASLTTSVNTLTTDMEEIKKKLDLLLEK